MHKVRVGGDSLPGTETDRTNFRTSAPGSATRPERSLNSDGKGIRVKRRFRLARSTDIKRVRQMGKSYAHPLVVLIALQNDSEISRFGFIAGRSVGGAVQRNRSKRLLRAGLEPIVKNVQSGWDLIFLARQPISQADYHQTQAAMQSLLRRANLLKETDAV